MLMKAIINTSLFKSKMTTFCLLVAITSFQLEAHAGGEWPRQPPRSDFFIAVDDGNLPMLRRMIEDGANVNAKDRVGITALMYAAFDKRKDVVDLLIEKGANVNATGVDNVTALMAATDSIAGMKRNFFGWPVNLSEIGSANAEKNMKLKHSVGREIVKTLLSHGADVNAERTDGTTALMGAYPEAIDLLVANGANLEAKNRDGETALLIATKGVDKEAVNLLLEKKANIRIRNNLGETLLMVAFKSSTPCNFGCFERGASQQQRNLPGIIEKFLANGLDVNATSNSGKTALFYFVESHHRSDHIVDNRILKMLLENGANVNAKDNNGETALMMATRKGNKAMMETLQKSGAR